MAAKKKSSARKYGAKASEKVAETMHERKRGTLRSGSGRKVTSKKQAIAIGLSEARKAGGKVPPKKGAKKTARKKATKTTKRGTKTTKRGTKTTKRGTKTTAKRATKKRASRAR